MNKDEMFENIVKDMLGEDYAITIIQGKTTTIASNTEKYVNRLIELGYRKVADDEIVIKKSELEGFERLARKYENLKAAQKTNDEHLHIRIKEQAKQETARKIAAKLKQHIAEIREFYKACIDVSYHGLTEQDIDDTLRELGIKLED